MFDSLFFRFCCRSQNNFLPPCFRTAYSDCICLFIRFILFLVQGKSLTYFFSTFAFVVASLHVGHLENFLATPVLELHIQFYFILLFFFNFISS